MSAPLANRLANSAYSTLNPELKSDPKTGLRLCRVHDSSTHRPACRAAPLMIRPQTPRRPPNLPATHRYRNGGQTNRYPCARREDPPRPVRDEPDRTPTNAPVQAGGPNASSVHSVKHADHPHRNRQTTGREATVSLTLAFLLGFLTGTSAGITGGTLLASFIRNRPRRARH